MKTLAILTGTLLLSTSAFAYDINGVALGSYVSDFADCTPSDQWGGAYWCRRTEATRNDRGGAAEIGRSRIVRDNKLYYINVSYGNAAWNEGEINRYLDQLDSGVVDGAKGRRTYLRIPGGDAVIAVWGNLQLVPINTNDRAAWASGQSPGNGVMVDYIGNLTKSAQAGLPIFRVASGVGYVWTASSVNGSGHMRKFAIDADALSGTPPVSQVSVPKQGTTSRESSGTGSRESSGTTSRESSGTGFFVAKNYILTNSHVIKECSNIYVSYPDRRPEKAFLSGQDATNDLALLHTDMPSSAVASFRFSPRLGEPVATYGFPLSGILSPGGNFTLGNVTSLSGLNDDTRVLQTSAPIQPGNSGGPLLDMTGSVIGVTEFQLSALVMLKELKQYSAERQFCHTNTDAHEFPDHKGRIANLGRQRTQNP